MPRLLWLETPPVHYGPQGWAASIKASARCVPFDESRERKHADETRDLEIMLRRYTAFITFVPLWRVSMGLHQEHPLVDGYHHTNRTAVRRARGIREGDPIPSDCLHYCEPSSALRTWVQLLLLALKM